MPEDGVSVKKWAYYNENDPHAAQWLRNLIDAGQLTPGEVDARSIVDVRPSDLVGFDRCHFFSGLGAWDHALALAGWPDDRPVWTGSCPCQPFSVAGSGRGVADERHLWPAWFRLIAECRPPTILGEQVASRAALGWLDAVCSDLEGADYAVGAADLPAAGVGAPHIRQRLWFVADADATGQREQRGGQVLHGERTSQRHDADGCRPNGELADAATARQHRGQESGADGGNPGALPPGRQGRSGLREPERSGPVDGMGDPGREGSGWHAGAVPRPQGTCAGERGRTGGQPDKPVVTSPACVMGDPGRTGLSNPEPPELRGARRRHQGAAAQQPSRAFWADADWLPCRDGKSRPVEPGSEPLVTRAAFDLGSGGPFEGKSRTAMLKGYGNALSPQVAAVFIRAVADPDFST